MHPGFEIPKHQQESGPSSAPAGLLSLNQTHILEQVHTLPSTHHQLFLDQNHFLSPPIHHQTRLSHQYIGGGGGGVGGSSAFFPVNSKPCLNEIRTRSGYKDGIVSGNINGGGGDALFRGSEHYEIPEARQSSLGMLHCWQNHQDSAIKQQPFWKTLPAEASNENCEIVDRQQDLEMKHKESPRNCLERKSMILFGELEAVYKRLGTDESNQTGLLPVNAHLPPGFDNESEASVGEEAASASLKNEGKKRRKKKKRGNQMIKPMSRFFESLVKQVMNHQENLHKKFTEVIERLDGERREREEAWRNQELAHFEQEAEARAHEKALAESREAKIVSFLEKITGKQINLQGAFSQH